VYYDLLEDDFRGPVVERANLANCRGPLGGGGLGAAAGGARYVKKKTGSHNRGLVRARMVDRRL